jgi:mannan endo-1,4-beta-mannosidase
MASFRGVSSSSYALDMIWNWLGGNLVSNLYGGHQRVTWVRSHAGLVACVAGAIALVLAVAIVRVSGVFSGNPTPAAAADSKPITYLGVYEPGVPDSYTGVEQFAHTVGRQPNLVSYYSGWGEEFQENFAKTAASHGATTIVEIDPTNISMAKIAAGTYDSYLTKFANEVAAFRHQVIISFGHEMNGFWETWGYTHTPATAFVAAWRHIVDLFRHQGANNVTWLWQVNSSSSRTGPVRDWWPGSQYVTWVGVSGYYYVPGNTFDNVFNPVVSEIRQFTQEPLLIAETAVGPQAGQSRGIEDLFAGLRLQHDIGLVWFDQHSYGGLYKGEDWRLEGDPTAIKAFQSALKG